MRFNLTGLSIADTRAPIETHAQLGGPGVVYNKALAIPVHIGPPWNSIEFVAIPPGKNGVGRHRQETDEIYLILRGKGTLVTNDLPRTLTPGMLAIAPRGTTHAICNDGAEEPLTFLVVELLVPADAPAHSPAFLNLLASLQESASDFYPVRVGQQRVPPLVARVNLSAYFAAPWGTLSLVSLSAGARVEEYIEAECDQLLFVVQGFASLRIRTGQEPDEEIRIDADNTYHQSVVVPRGVPRSFANRASGNYPLTVACLNVLRVEGADAARRGVPEVSEARA